MPTDQTNDDAEQKEVIELSDEVTSEVERRVEKRQKLVEEANEKGRAFESAREEAEDQIESNQTYMEAVANVNGVSMDDYVYEDGTLRPMTEEEKVELERQKLRESRERSPAEKPVSTDLSTENAVLQIRKNGLDSIVIPDEEDRMLVMEAVEEAREE